MTICGDVCCAYSSLLQLHGDNFPYLKGSLATGGLTVHRDNEINCEESRDQVPLLTGLLQPAAPMMITAKDPPPAAPMTTFEETQRPLPPVTAPPPAAPMTTLEVYDPQVKPNGCFHLASTRIRRGLAPQIGAVIIPTQPGYCDDKLVNAGNLPPSIVLIVEDENKDLSPLWDALFSKKVVSRGDDITVVVYGKKFNKPLVVNIGTLDKQLFQELVKARKSDGNTKKWYKSSGTSI